MPRSCPAHLNQPWWRRPGRAIQSSTARRGNTTAGTFMKNLDRRFAPAFIFALICACSSGGESTAPEPTGGGAGAAGDPENPDGMADPLTPGGPAGSGGSANGEG